MAAIPTTCRAATLSRHVALPRVAHGASAPAHVEARAKWRQSSTFGACGSCALLSGVLAGRSQRCRKQRLHFSTLSASSQDNVALVFVKPHAATPKVLELVPKFLQDHGLQVLRTGSVESKDIEEKGIIDAHYAAIAAVGMARDMTTLGLETVAEKFQVYGKPLQDAMAAGEVCSAITAMEILDVTPSELLRRCLAAGYEKLRSGLYCARLEGGKTGQLFVLNGFYSRMREKFTTEGVTVHWYVVHWSPTQLSWANFRSKVIGATNPKDAMDGSLRARIRDEWESLGLKEETNYQDNGVHASAGPLEALRERMVWLGDEVETDNFGQEVRATCQIGLNELMENPIIEVQGKAGPAFDLLEECDVKEALEVLASAKLV